LAIFRKKDDQKAAEPVPDGAVLPLKQGERTRFQPEPAGRQGLGKHEGRPSDMNADAKTLIIGREINLKGEIGECESLMVHGSAEAVLSNCRSFTITESGLLKGEADVQSAEVLGRFEGTLKVRGLLTIRKGGRVSGTISYAEVEIEQGGRLDGQIDTVEPELVGGRAAGIRA